LYLLLLYFGAIVIVTEGMHIDSVGGNKRMHSSFWLKKLAILQM